MKIYVSLVHTVILNGEVWFVAKDVCDILGLNERAKYFLGRQGEANIINEPGLYWLLFRSNKPEAKAFSRWVKHDVLPTLHRTGSYSIRQDYPIAQIDPMQVAKTVFEAAKIKDNQLALALDKVAVHYTGQSMLALGGINLIAPVQCQMLNPTQIGEHFGVSARKVNQVLVDGGYQIKTDAGYEPTDLGEPFAVMLDVNKPHFDGTPIRQLKWNSDIIDEITYLF